jgi:hypothetical protein
VAYWVDAKVMGHFLKFLKFNLFLKNYESSMNSPLVSMTSTQLNFLVELKRLVTPLNVNIEAPLLIPGNEITKLFVCLVQFFFSDRNFSHVVLIDLQPYLETKRSCLK